jgi:hypothetical protein
MILQNYTTVSKFVSFDNQSSWPTATVVAHGGLRSNHVTTRLGKYRTIA